MIDWEEVKKYWRRIKWLWKHRHEKNCRQKWRRMDRELSNY